MKPKQKHIVQSLKETEILTQYDKKQEELKVFEENRIIMNTLKATEK